MAKLSGDIGEPATTDDLEKQQETRNEHFVHAVMYYGFVCTNL
jgi:hypothetical protein